MTSFSRVLVAGGAGFIGSHIVDRLLREDVDVIALDNLYAGKLENIAHHEGNRKFKFVQGDVRNYDLVSRLVKDVDAVFNEAAVVSVARSMEDPVLANEVNVGGTLTLLKASLEAGVKKFVQASSASVYGNTKTLPIKETTRASPVSPYAVAELAAENYARVFYSSYGLETVCLRYFNVYGPRQAFNVYSGVIMIFLNDLIQNRPPAIFGDGEQTRDFVYVEDVIEANMRALMRKEGVGEMFNIATGRPSTINELVRILQEKMGKRHLKPNYKNRRSGDIRHSYANIEKAGKILGYVPKNDLEKGLTQLIAWFSNSNSNEASA